MQNNDSYSKLIIELHGRYKDHSNIDKALTAQGSLDKVAGVMRENVGRMFSNKQQMFDIESKSGGLKDTASRFKVQT